MIKVFITGGTIDWIDSDTGRKNETSVIPSLLERANITVDYLTELLMMKDSREVTQEDREFIFKKCQECAEDKIVITHGTMTMVDTAKYLGLRNIPKTIILTGAMETAVGNEVEAAFNLGFAIANVQNLKPGVYIAMNGKLFDWDKTHKNLKRKCFEENTAAV